MTDERDLRPDHEMEGRVNTWLTDTDLAPSEANAGLDRLLQEFPVTPQARRRFLGRWFRHDHPPDTGGNKQLMFTGTAIVGVITALAVSV